MDSILVAVAMSPKIWVIITGGILGIIAMRLVIGQLLRVVRRYPALVDGAFIIIAWVAIKLLIEYLGPHGLKLIDFEINKWFSLGLIVVIFSIAYFYARKKGAVAEDDEEEAAELLEKGGPLDREDGRWKMEKGGTSSDVAEAAALFHLPSGRLAAARYMPSSLRSRVFTSPSLDARSVVALLFSRSRTSGSFHSPCGMYSSAIA